VFRRLAATLWCRLSACQCSLKGCTTKEGICGAAL
jgi:hypothetical protein